jgi:hypothetical protein
MDPATVQERGRQVAQEWSRAMEDAKTGTVRDFVAVGDVQIKVIGGEAPILESEVPVRQILEQLVSKTALPPYTCEENSPCIWVWQAAFCGCCWGLLPPNGSMRF